MGKFYFSSVVMSGYLVCFLMPNLAAGQAPQYVQSPNIEKYCVTRLDALRKFYSANGVEKTQAWFQTDAWRAVNGPVMSTFQVIAPKDETVVASSTFTEMIGLTNYLDISDANGSTILKPVRDALKSGKPIYTGASIFQSQTSGEITNWSFLVAYVSPADPSLLICFAENKSLEAVQ